MVSRVNYCRLVNICNLHILTRVDPMQTLKKFSSKTCTSPLSNVRSELLTNMQYPAYGYGIETS